MSQSQSQQSRSLRRLVPLWVWRVVPIRFTRWAYRAELARGAEYAERLGWEPSIGKHWCICYRHPCICNSPDAAAKTGEQR